MAGVFKDLMAIGRYLFFPGKMAVIVKVDGVAPQDKIINPRLDLIAAC